ncbi:hypothetical protein NP493_1406g01016 [Ridgeia piscesae]|uniref:CCHC-type domain-containing protein n=1 Tax=Ridgeia piscesae TaxID=27915 RepID=A0AAD9NDH1_RIDPI|nr:hypothetical protein NP493_1406g01016 [Ridgeia piscesae]
MEKAAATEAEGRALALLRDTALKYQFIEGVQEQSVRRELRRIAFHSAGKPFHHMRNEALCLLDDEQQCASEGQDSSPVNSRLLEIAQMQQQLQTQVMQLVSQQCQTAGQMQGHFIKECPKKRAPSKRCNCGGTSCFHCKQEGHFVRDCPQKKCVDVRSRGPEQSSAQVTHLATDQIDGALSKEVTERLGIAEGRIVELEGRLLEVQLRQQVVSLQVDQEQMRVQGEELHMVANENLGLAARLHKANVEISTLRFSVESARADAVVARSKNAQLINQLKGNQVECGVLVKQLGELEELTEQKSQFSEQVAELQCHMSTVGKKREATVCPREATRVDVELFQSEAERLKYERCELTVSRKHRHWLHGCVETTT